MSNCWLVWCPANTIVIASSSYFPGRNAGENWVKLGKPMAIIYANWFGPLAERKLMGWDGRGTRRGRQTSHAPVEDSALQMNCVTVIFLEPNSILIWENKCTEEEESPL